MAVSVTISPALAKAAEAAWARYSSTCRLGGTREQRAWAYKTARQAEQQVWAARGFPAALV